MPRSHDSKRLIRLYDFENRLLHFFPDVDNRFKFCILNYGGAEAAAANADFFFFAHQVEDLEDSKRHISLANGDIRLFNPNTHTCPIFRTPRDAEITKAIYRRIHVLIDRNREGPTGNPWGVQFKRMFDQTNDAELFREADALKAEGFKLEGQSLDQREADVPAVVRSKDAPRLRPPRRRRGDRQVATGSAKGKPQKRHLVDHQNPEHLATPRFWVSEEDVLGQIARAGFALSLLQGRDQPDEPADHDRGHDALGRRPQPSAPIVTAAVSPRRQCCLLANLNSFVYDFSRGRRSATFT